MYKTFKHNGKIGDVIFSLPTIRELGGGILYIPENTPDACNGMHSSLKDLLLQQPYIHEVREYPSGLTYGEQAPGIHIDYDLDDARRQPLKGVIHIVKRYMDAFGINYPSWKEPWLQLPDEKTFRWSFWKQMQTDGYVLINYTGRHIFNDQMKITSQVNWKNIIESIKARVYFIGLEHEWESFWEMTGIRMPFLNTYNMLEVAFLIQGAKAIYCNQSSILALAQSMGKEYYMAPKPMKQNCLLYTSNEHILQ